MAISETVPPQNDVVRLDPFAFLASSASRIVGLGGDHPADDSAYAFHSPYGSLKTGQTTFVLRFRGLRASVGNLTLLVNALSPLAGSVARTVKMSAHPLRDVAATGELSVTVNTKAHLSYAVLGLIYGPTNASADALEIEAYQSEGDVGDALAEHEIVFTEFGDVKLRQMSLLASSTPATLAHPVSQTPTNAQYLEPAFAHWARLADRPDHVDEEIWALAYVLSALDCYGMMADGSRGVGMCADGQPVHAALLAAGSASTLLTDQTADAIPDQVAKQDYSWSIDAVNQPAMAAATRIDIMLEPLKIGGISVHVLPYDAGHPGGNWTACGNAMTRSDLDRLILQLLTAGHDVAQLKISHEPCDRHVGRVGIVIRKGRSTFY